MSARPRVLVAVDKFKGCLAAHEVAAHLRSGLASELADAEIRLHPVSDGGDGFATELASLGYAIHRAPVNDPLGRPIQAPFAVGQGAAVIEMAASSGLALLSPGERDPLRADTFGLGMLIRAALDHRPDLIVIGAGGSATSDGGAGALAALGAVLHTTSGGPRHYGPQTLLALRELDVSKLLVPDDHGVRIRVATDVTSPLLGPTGAAAVFGPQKGADPEQVATIERALTHWADVAEAATGRAVRDTPSAGAAGGLAFGLATGLGAELADGIDTFAALSGLKEAIAWADVVITGEGSLDAQTTSGKAPVGVLRYARSLGRPCWAVVGRSKLSDDEVAGLGFIGHLALADSAPDERSSMRRAPHWLAEAGRTLGSHFASGRTSTPLSGLALDGADLG